MSRKDMIMNIDDRNTNIITYEENIVVISSNDERKALHPSHIDIQSFSPDL